MKNQTAENRREFIRRASIIIHEGNNYLEIFMRPQVIENSGDICVSEQIFYRKQTFGAPAITTPKIRYPPR